MGRKFAFGLTVQSLQIFSSNTDWQQETASELMKSQRQRRNAQPGAFDRTPVNEQVYPEIGSDQGNRLVKEVAAVNVQTYYEADANIIIPFDEI